MRKLAYILLVVLIIGLAITFARNIIGFHLFSNDWMVGPIIIIICFIFAMIMAIYYISKKK